MSVISWLLILDISPMMLEISHNFKTHNFRNWYAQNLFTISRRRSVCTYQLVPTSANIPLISILPLTLNKLQEIVRLLTWPPHESHYYYSCVYLSTLLWRLQD